MCVTFEVWTDSHGGTLLAVKRRMARQHSGWFSVWYLGKRYQLLGGLRVPFFINLSRPI